MIHQRQPRVTVITGYYNREYAVDATIRSILGQTFTDLRLIAFDDCSSDRTAERLIALQEELRDPRFEVITHRDNIGFTRGMIEAISSSRSEYICVQGSGDISLPRRVELQVAALDADESVGAVGCWYTNVVTTSGARRPRQPDANAVSFAELLKGNVFSHGEVMLRRSTYEAVGGYRAEFKFAQDYDLWLRLVQIAKLHTVRAFLYERHVRFDGVSYHPEKFPLQARYSLLARRIAQMDESTAARALETLRQEGPLAAIPADDPELQTRVTKAVLRSAIFDGGAEARDLAMAAVTGRFRRTALIKACELLDLRAMIPIRRQIHRFLGISSGGRSGASGRK